MGGAGEHGVSTQLRRRYVDANAKQEKCARREGHARSRLVLTPRPGSCIATMHQKACSVGICIISVPAIIPIPWKPVDKCVRRFNRAKCNAAGTQVQAQGQGSVQKAAVGVPGA